MASWAVDLFGQELLTKDGMKATAEVVDGKKAVLVYFSAHWCPPCRGFTPMLADAYKKYSAGDLEVIFVSSDRDEGSFSSYFSEMPWTAVPFANRGQKDQLSQKFSVSGIPKLIVLNGADGEVVSENGRGEVMKTSDLAQSLNLWGLGNTTGPSSVASTSTGPSSVDLAGGSHWGADLFGDIILTKSGKKSTKEVLSGKKVVLVYFSAHWCPPCRGFTPVLAEVYKNHSANDVEIIFVSSDQNQGSFDSYFGEMPWMALPFADRDQKSKISAKFDVKGIPTLVVLNGEDGKTISLDGRGHVQQKGSMEACLRLWAKEGPTNSKKSCCCVIS